jgi:hypothetical protein
MSAKQCPQCRGWLEDEEALDQHMVSCNRIRREIDRDD